MHYILCSSDDRVHLFLLVSTKLFREFLQWSQIIDLVTQSLLSKITWSNLTKVLRRQRRQVSAKIFARHCQRSSKGWHFLWDMKIRFPYSSTL
jgi:hypothetical protein